MRTTLSLALLLSVACQAVPPADRPLPPSPPEALLPEELDLVSRIAEGQARPPAESIHAVMNSLEHLLPAWMAEQRRGRAAPLEGVLTQKVVVAFDGILEMFESGPHERRLVAAWALGFSRVPANDLGVLSRHEQARDALVAQIALASDDVLNNILLGLWILADDGTPLDLLTDILVEHHDPMARANATLVLSTVLTRQTARNVTGSLLVALDDTEARVRLHAARVAIEFPDPALTVRIEEKLAREETPLVQAAFARALGAARSVTSGPLLVRLLGNPREVIASSAHDALVRIYGQDLGDTADDWELVAQP